MKKKCVVCKSELEEVVSAGGIRTLRYVCPKCRLVYDFP